MARISTGPTLLIHILILTMIDAILLPVFYQWSGSILYTFLISVGVLCLYGLLVLSLFGRKRG
jgi:hypothetical protein